MLPHVLHAEKDSEDDVILLIQVAKALAVFISDPLRNLHAEIGKQLGASEVAEIGFQRAS